MTAPDLSGSRAGIPPIGAASKTSTLPKPQSQEKIDFGFSLAAARSSLSSTSQTGALGLLPASVSRGPVTGNDSFSVPVSGAHKLSILPVQKLSNLDRNGKLVKRGLTVSYHGLRYVVVKVRAGRFVGRVASVQVGKLYEREDRLTCEAVQIVA